MEVVYKFRAWYPDQNRMEYSKGKTPLWMGDILNDSYYKPMQYIGINDKYGKEIYADDLMRDDCGRVFRIYSVPGGFAVKANYWAGNINNLTLSDELIMMPLADSQNLKWIKQCEIVGNIYEQANFNIKTEK